MVWPITASQRSLTRVSSRTLRPVLCASNARCAATSVIYALARRPQPRRSAVRDPLPRRWSLARCGASSGSWQMRRREAAIEVDGLVKVSSAVDAG